MKLEKDILYCVPETGALGFGDEWPTDEDCSGLQVEDDPKLIAIYRFSKDSYACKSDGENEYCASRGTYLVLDDCEADNMVRENIRGSLWAFRASFLAHYMDNGHILKDIISKLQEQEYESCNEAIYALVAESFDDLVEDAISADGRGHFLAPYDFEEHEQDDYFIYRTN